MRDAVIRFFGNLPRWALVAAGVTGVVVVGVLLVAPFSPVSVVRTVVELDQSAGPDLGINLEEVTHDPAEFYNESMTVSGQVSELIGPHALVIGREGWRFSWGSEREPFVLIEGDELLVVSPTGWPASVQPGTVVAVHGRLQPLQPVQLGLKLDVDFEAQATLLEREGDPVLVVDQVFVDPPATNLGGDPEDLADSAGLDVGVEVSDVAEDLEEFEGKQVLLSGEAEELVGEYTFLLTDEELPIVVPQTVEGVVEEAVTYVVGTVRRLDIKQLEQTLDIDLEDEALAEFEGGPVVVVDRIMVIR